MNEEKYAQLAEYIKQVLKFDNIYTIWDVTNLYTDKRDLYLLVHTLTEQMSEKTFNIKKYSIKTLKLQFDVFYRTLINTDRYNCEQFLEKTK